VEINDTQHRDGHTNVWLKLLYDHGNPDLKLGHLWRIKVLEISYPTV